MNSRFWMATVMVNGFDFQDEVAVGLFATEQEAREAAQGFAVELCNTIDEDSWFGTPEVEFWASPMDVGVNIWDAREWCQVHDIEAVEE